MSGIKKMIQLGAPGTSTQERFEAGGFQCPQCKGRGYHWGNERDPKREACPRCKGSGRLKAEIVITWKPE